MIYDRTANDVILAKRIRELKIQKGIELSEEDIDVLERGCVTANTLNRIESKQDELKNILNDMGYFNTPIFNKSWDEKDYFIEKDLKRICENNSHLMKAFFVFANTPKFATPRYHYEAFNILEKMLSDLDDMTDYVKSQYKECDTFYCGEV